jgi:hypothetical protein
LIPLRQFEPAQAAMQLFFNRCQFLSLVNALFMKLKIKLNDRKGSPVERY